MKTHLPICMKKVNYEFTVAGKKKGETGLEKK